MQVYGAQKRSDMRTSWRPPLFALRSSNHRLGSLCDGDDVDRSLMQEPKA